MTPERHYSPTVAFDYFEIVRVRPTPSDRASEIAGLEGAVLGISEDEGRIVSYAISIYDRDGMCWSVDPADLEATGRHDRRESFYDGSSLRVSVRGEVLDPPHT
jgi:hypothetical protein